MQLVSQRLNPWRLHSKWWCYFTFLTRFEVLASLRSTVKSLSVRSSNIKIWNIRKSSLHVWWIWSKFGKYSQLINNLYLSSPLLQNAEMVLSFSTYVNLENKTFWMPLPQRCTVFSLEYYSLIFFFKFAVNFSANW